MINSNKLNLFRNTKSIGFTDVEIVNNDCGCIKLESINDKNFSKSRILSQPIHVGTPINKEVPTWWSPGGGAPFNNRDLRSNAINAPCICFWLGNFETPQGCAGTGCN